MLTLSHNVHKTCTRPYHDSTPSDTTGEKGLGCLIDMPAVNISNIVVPGVLSSPIYPSHPSHFHLHRGPHPHPPSSVYPPTHPASHPHYPPPLRPLPLPPHPRRHLPPLPAPHPPSHQFHPLFLNPQEPAQHPLLLLLRQLPLPHVASSSRGLVHRHLRPCDLTQGLQLLRRRWRLLLIHRPCRHLLASHRWTSCGLRCVSRFAVP